jgi:hypothetical protein
VFWDWVKIGVIPLGAITVPIFLYALPTLLGYLSYVAKYVIWMIHGIAAAVAIVIGVIAGECSTMMDLV